MTRTGSAAPDQITCRLGKTLPLFNRYWKIAYSEQPAAPGKSEMIRGLIELGIRTAAARLPAAQRDQILED